MKSPAVNLAGSAFIFISLVHIPNKVFPHGFDKNATAQLISLLSVAGGFALFMTVKPERFRFPRIVGWGIASLILTQFASLLMSGALISSLFGDTGRYVGTASVIALLITSIFHSQFNFQNFLVLLRYYLVAIELVVLLAFAQYLDVVELPGNEGMTSTLGNLDFFAAYVGTSIPLLVLLAMYSKRSTQILIAFSLLLNIFALYLAGPLQGFLDVFFAVVGVSIFLFRKKIPRLAWSLNVRTYIGAFAVLIWAEFIFLFPFLADFVPVLGNDEQVKIRSNFWLAGTRQFFAHPLLGVGPDQYGNNYEQYRTFEDISKYTNILSNDAHSASVQTLATVGILGTSAFIFLIAILVRSILILWDTRKFDRKAIYILGLFIFIYLTNSFISPITLSHKFVFWSVSGFIIGQVYRLPSRKSQANFVSRLSAVSAVVTMAALAILFAQAHMNYLSNIEKYAADNSVILQYQASPILPCMMFFDAELLIAKNVGSEEASRLAEEELVNSPRCVAAQTFLAQSAVDRGEVESLRERIYLLNEIAPARNSSISLGMYYATRAGDLALQRELEKRMKALGLIYIPGKLG